VTAVSDQERQRRQRLATRLADADQPAALITRPVNVRYLTGLVSSNAAVLVYADGSAVLATDFRYRAAAPDDIDLVDARNVAVALVARAGTDGVRRLGFEEHEVTVEGHDELMQAAESAKLELARLHRAVEAIRLVKDDAELDSLRHACAVADEALAGLLPTVRPGRTEREIARDLDERIRDLGAEGPSFESIIAAGPHSAIPHHRPSDRPVEKGDLLKLDFGALVDGYCSDMTRTVCVGTPADWQREIHAIVLAAQAAGRAAAVPGAVANDVDAAARSVVSDAGYAEEFPHGLGHGVGLEIHEAPALRAGATDRLDVDIPVTVEPGIYLPGRGGVRIEDTVVVRAADGPEVLTKTSRDLLVL